MSIRTPTAFEVLGIGFFLFLGFILFKLSVSDKGYMYIIPEGFNGWTCEYFGELNAPSLNVEDGFQVINIPVSGIFKTSDSGVSSKGRKNIYFLLKADGTRQLMPKEYMGGAFTYTPSESSSDQYVSVIWFGKDHSNYLPTPFTPSAARADCGPR